MVDVVAALIRKDGRILICRRPPDKARALLWEFPGGKIEKGESPEEALRRECMEELDVRLSVGRLYTQATHAYPDITVRLSLYEAALEEGSPRMKEHAALAWIRPEEIEDYAFCPADIDIIAKIRAEAL